MGGQKQSSSCNFVFRVRFWNHSLSCFLHKTSLQNDSWPPPPHLLLSPSAFESLNSWQLKNQIFTNFFPLPHSINSQNGGFHFRSKGKDFFSPPGALGQNVRSAFGISLLFNTFLLWAKALGGGARAAEPGRPAGFGHSDILLLLRFLIDWRTKKIHPIYGCEQNSGRGRF